MKLSEVAVRKAKPEAKPYKMADGGGMYLEVMPSGSKYWRLKYRYAGKEKRLALGVYPDISLADARGRRDDARKLLANGSDPGVVKQSQKRQAKISAANSFEAIAREFHTMKSPIWTAHHATDWINTLEREVFPKFGHRPIIEIEAPDVLDILRAIEARGAFEVRGRVLQRVRAVFAYAIASGRARHNPAAELRGALAPRPKVQHFAALSEKEMPEFLRALSDYQLRAKSSPVVFAATRLLALTFVRTGEVRGAQWGEFDLDAGLWTIPAERMKARAPHTVPLSRQDLRRSRDHPGCLCGIPHSFPAKSNSLDSKLISFLIVEAETVLSRALR